ncbi:MAG TPA: M28 family peptidase [Acidobacteriaceae bacterium]|jgi:hypothetical protein|nr:M28 family peptidase [Acidobacteriaceae bacterium]
MGTIKSLVVVVAVFTGSGAVSRAQQQQTPSSTPLGGRQGQQTSVYGTLYGRAINGISKVPYTLDQEYLEWPLPPDDKQYGAIEGKRLKGYVADLVGIAEHYRDQGNQFWGRITGTSSDTETQDWLIGKFKAAGLSDVHSQPLDTPPQWIPTSWRVAATGEGKSLQLDSAQPMMSSPATPDQGLNLDAVWVGLGTEADFSGRDVRGKAVFIYSATYNHINTSALLNGSVKRAASKGAAAIFIIFALPGNIKAQFYNLGVQVPTFAIGLDDGNSVRAMIEQAEPSSPPKVSLVLHTAMVPGKTGNVWGTLPGMTDEKIYIISMREGWFDGATNNAAGIATLVGLADYFGKIPKEKRRRTMIFLATTGHHGNGVDGKPHVTLSGVWITEHHAELFKNTALILNCEYTATTQTELYMGGQVQSTDAQSEGLYWFVRGAPQLTQAAYNAYREFGVPIFSQPSPSPVGEMYGFDQFAPSLQLINMGTYSHTNYDTLAMVPWTGLEAVTRAYAKVIDDVNRYSIPQLAWPWGEKAAPQGSSSGGTATGGNRP